MADTCKYCGSADVLPPDPVEPGQVFRFMGGICGTCCDVEFCCNVSKDKYGTKSLAHLVAEEYGMQDVLARFAEKEANHA